MKSTLTCPECNGEGGHVYQMADGDWDGERCDTCYGSGTVRKPIPTCPECDKVVRQRGDTCDLRCYASFLRALKYDPALHAGDIPKDMLDQPWYAAQL